ncbi:MAG: hypothetical protein KDA84_26485 [Planctomycetaceae bacterium]|nr:hypothetical protein [Planctomycetaceae bacterium]
MKSEERHRLQESELEKWGRHAQSFLETFLKDYAKITLIALVIVAAVGVALGVYFSNSTSEEEERWNKVISASFDRDPSQSLVQLSAAATDYSDYPAGQWAALLQAEGALSEGVRATRTNRPAAVEELVRARDAFDKLAKADSGILQERRAFGMARTLEALAGVDVSKDDKGQNVEGVKDALTAYEKSVEEYPESIFVPLAEDRIKALKEPQTQNFYAWFRDQYPRPEDRAAPRDGFGPPGMGSGLPAGHPPVSPRSSDTAPPFPPNFSPGGQTSDGSPSDDGTPKPATAEKPMKSGGPELLSPNQPNSKANPTDNTTPPDSNKKPDETKPENPTAKPDEKKPESSTPAPDEKDKTKPAPTDGKQPEKPATDEKKPASGTNETKPEKSAPETSKPDSTPK